jgi:PUA domain protein
MKLEVGPSIALPLSHLAALQFATCNHHIHFLLSNLHHFATMFRKFDPSTDISTSTQVKASVQRHLKSQIAQAHPNITEEQLDALLPKKPPLVQYKVGPHMMLYCRRVEHEDASPTDEPVFFQHRDGPMLPALKMVHKYPALNFTQVTVDKGAIPFLLGGANVMSPGLTNPGGAMPPDGEEKDENGFDKPGLSKGDGVVLYAEGKEHAIAIGVMTMSSSEM